MTIKNNKYRYMMLLSCVPNRNNYLCKHLSIPASNMANFLFYHYDFVKTDDRNLFSKDDNEQVTGDYLNGKFADDLASKATVGNAGLNLYEFKVDRRNEETSESYVNEVKRSVDGVVMLQVRNNKHKKIMPIDKVEALDVPHYPYTLVIVDTRPGSHAILVQHKKDAFQNPDTVASLIVDYFTRVQALPNLGWDMKIQKRLCKGSIWDVVKVRTAKGQDRVKSLIVKLDGKRQNPKNEVDRLMQLMLKNFSALEGELKLTSDDAAKSLLDENQENVRNTVNMLIESNYRMKIGFDRSGTVEYGHDAEAVYGISDDYCKEFENGEMHFGDDGMPVFNLIQWLNTLMPEDDSHIYALSEKKKRNGRKAKM